jgi:membrane-associated PAP2 superfamily phosphatase
MEKPLNLPGIGFCVVSFLGCIVSFIWLDNPLQLQFFDLLSQKWSITGAESLIRLFCYHIPKSFFGALITFLLIKPLFSKGGTKEIFAAIFLLFSPISVAIIKIFTGVECPKDLLCYGGHQPELSLLESMFKGTGRCFPGGHVSAGFGLYVALTLLSPEKRWKGFIAITFLGHFMGFYQIARGYHFISHNLATMGLSYGFFLINQTLLKELEKEGDLFLDKLKGFFKIRFISKRFLK